MKSAFIEENSFFCVCSPIQRPECWMHKIYIVSRFTKNLAHYCAIGNFWLIHHKHSTKMIQFIGIYRQHILHDCSTWCKMYSLHGTAKKERKQFFFIRFILQHQRWKESIFWCNNNILKKTAAHKCQQAYDFKVMFLIKMNALWFSASS